MRNFFKLAMFFASVTISFGHFVVAQTQPAQTQPLQGSATVGVPSAAQIQSWEADCANPTMAFGGAEPCIALSLQERGINNDPTCLPLIAEGMTNLLQQLALRPNPANVSPAAEQQLVQLNNALTQISEQTSAHGCLNPDPGTPKPPSNTAASPEACQAYWNNWYAEAVGHCQASGGGETCIAQVNATQKVGMASCTGQGVPQTPTKPTAQQSCQADDTIPTSGNEAQFLNGFATGVGQCAWAACTNPVTIAAVGVAIWKSEYQQVVNLFGLVTGATTLQSMMQGGGEQITSADPYQMGLTEGKRFCMWEAAWFGVMNAGIRAGATPSGPSASQPGQCTMQMPQGLGGVMSGASPAYHVCSAGSAPPPCNVSLPTGLQGLILSERPAAGATCPISALGNFRALLQDTSWLQGINNQACSTNCGNCVLAVAQALLGKGLGRTLPVCIQGTATTRLESVFGTKFIEYTNIADVSNAMSASGDGAQGIVYVGNGTTTGHFFNIVNDGGNVRLLDGQVGKEIDWTLVQSWMQQGNWNTLGLLRTN